MDAYQPSDQFDPLAKLYKMHAELLAAGARGEPVAEQLKMVRGSIRDIIEQRQQPEHQQER